MDEYTQWDNIKTQSLSVPNTALNFLLMNDEQERALQLQDFVQRLENTTNNTPWFFQQIDGLDEALNRTWFKEQKIEEERKQISIKCLPESIDTNIGSMFDLYRSSCFSYINKKEVVPANLRKFDMGIYLFSRPLIYNRIIDNEIGDWDKGTFGVHNYGTNRMNTKYIELRGCEFDYNTLSDGYSSLDNTSGKDEEYSIKISYDDVYEMRYNEKLNDVFGDLIAADLLEEQKEKFGFENASNMNYDVDFDSKKNKASNTLKENAKRLSKEILNSTKETIKNRAKQEAKDYINKKILGNIYKNSLLDVADVENNLSNLDLIGATKEIKDFKKASFDNSKESLEKQYPKNRKLGNINKKQLLNNI